MNTPVTPNMLTTGRLVTGIAACAAFVPNDPEWTFWGGILWLVSCLLDRADGELARLSKKTSPWGHRYDYYCDVAVNGILFIAIGFALRGGALGDWAVALGCLAGVSVAAASILSELVEQLADDGAKAYSGILGFDFDDLLYLLAPAAWFGAFPFILVGAAVCTPVVTVLTAYRYYRLRQAQLAASLSA